MKEIKTTTNGTDAIRWFRYGLKVKVVCDNGISFVAENESDINANTGSAVFIGFEV